MDRQYKRFRKISSSSMTFRDGRHRFEHWLIDNQVYFITARCRDRYLAFASERGKAVFWDRFLHHTRDNGFYPWITSLLDNHYHTLGYLRVGEKLPRLMQRIHGSVAKLVNDHLDPPLKPFWREREGHEYFDGCIRDEKQCRQAYRYTQRQSVRHGLCRDWREYPHTRIEIELERGVKRARELGAFLQSVPYKRYESKR